MGIQTRNRTSGFTLIELAIVMVITGLVVAGMLNLYTSQMKRGVVTETKDNVADVSDAIVAFQVANGYYPCPALGSDPKAMATNCNSTAGLDASIKRTATGVSGQILRTGVIPLSAYDKNGEIVQLVHGDQAVDGYKNRLTYAVIESMAIDEAKFTAAGSGSIVVLDANNPTATPLSTTSEYVLFSSGPDGVGSYSSTGALRAPCKPATLDGKNCDGDATFYDNHSGARSTTGDNNNYDDFFVAQTIKSTPMSCNDDEELRGVDFTNKKVACVARDLDCNNISEAFVGLKWIGTGSNKRITAECRSFTATCSTGFVLARVEGDNPTCVRNTRGQCPSGQVQVGTDVEKGTAFGKPICASLANSCNNTQVQVGTNTDGTPICADRMKDDKCTGQTILTGYNSNGTPYCSSAPKCAAGKFVTGISNGNLICEQPEKLNESCPSGQVMTGIKNNKIVCEIVQPDSDALAYGFGGMFSRGSSFGCGSPNYLTGACTCPPGFGMEILATNISGGEQFLFYCRAVGDPPTSNPEKFDFGGVYSLASSKSCFHVNAFTGTCGCPSGFKAKQLATNINGGEQYLYYCMR